MEKKDRWDHHLIYKLIAPRSSVLDLGCGNGELLSQPVTGSLPYQWYETPNIHLFTLYDFLDWVVQNGVNIIDSYAWKAGSCSHLKLPEDSTEAEELLFVIEQAC